MAKIAVEVKKAINESCITTDAQIRRDAANMLKPYSSDIDSLDYYGGAEQTYTSLCMKIFTVMTTLIMSASTLIASAAIQCVFILMERM